MTNVLAIALVGGLALAACAPSSAADPNLTPSSRPSAAAEASTMDIEQRNREAVRRVYDEVLNTGKLELLAQMVSDDYVAPDGKRGAGALSERLGKLRDAFPDIHYTVEDLVVEGERVAVRWTWEGTHLGPGPFRVLAPTGKRVKNTGMAVYRMRDGKVVGIVMETDRLGFLQAVGVVAPDIAGPPPAASASPGR
jgi:predicted ester cyclase